MYHYLHDLFVCLFLSSAIVIFLSQLNCLGLLCFGGESRDGAVVRALASHQCGPGSIPRLGVVCGLSLLLALILAPRGFSPGTPVFPSPQKPTLPNSSLTWIIVKHFIMSLALEIVQVLPVSLISNTCKLRYVLYLIVN